MTRTEPFEHQQFGTAGIEGVNLPTSFSGCRQSLDVSWWPTGWR